LWLLRLGGERRGEETTPYGHEERTSVHTSLRLAEWDGAGRKGPGRSNLHQRGGPRDYDLPATLA
jgi:hypothetical protein